MPTTSVVSLSQRAVGHRPPHVADDDAGHQRDGRDTDDGQPQSWTVVVGADGHPVAPCENEVDDDALDDQQAQHRRHRHPPQRPAPVRRRCRPGRRSALPARATSKASTRKRFLIGSAPAARSAACRRRRRRRAEAFQRTVCGFSAPAFSLIDVATTITVSVRDAEPNNSGCCWGGGEPFGPGCSWWIDSTATESTWPVVFDLQLLHQLAVRLDGRIEVGVELTDRALVQGVAGLPSMLSLFMLIRTLVQSAAACITRAGSGARRRRCGAPTRSSEPKTIAATATSPSSRRGDAVTGEDGPSSSSWSGGRSSSGMGERLRRSLRDWFPGLPEMAVTAGSRLTTRYLHDQTRLAACWGDRSFAAERERPIGPESTSPRRLRCPPARRPVRPCQRPLADRVRDPGRPRDRRRVPVAPRPRRGAGPRPDHRGRCGGRHQGTDEQRIGDLYASFMDEPTVAERGVQPLLDELAAIDAAETPEALAAVVGVLQRTGVGGGTGVYVDTDSKNSTRYLVHLNQSGLGLPDESYYRDAQHAEILAAYPQHIAAMFALVYGGPEHAETAATHRRAGNQARRRTLGRRQASRRRPHLQPAHVRRPARRGPGLRLDRLGHRAGRDAGEGGGTRCAPARLPDRVRRGLVGRGARGLEELGSLAADPRSRVAAHRRPGRRGLRLLRPHAQRHRGDPGPLEARRLGGREPDGRRGRQALRRAALPAGCQGAHGRTGRQPARGLPRQHQRPGVDDAGDPRAGAGQAGQVHPEDRLPGEVAGLLDAGHRARRPVRQLPSRVRGRAPTASWPSSAAQWTATSGS